MRARKAVASSLAVGSLRIPAKDQQALVTGGQALQRMWLTATQHRLAIYPWTALAFLSHRVDQASFGTLDQEERGWLTHLRDQYRQLLPLPANQEEIFFHVPRDKWAQRAETPWAGMAMRPLLLFFPDPQIAVDCKIFFP